MKVRLLLVGILVFAAVLGPWSATGSPGTPAQPTSVPDSHPDRFARDVVPFLTRHCFTCHGNGKDRGGLALDKYPDGEAIQKDRDVWENVLHAVRTGDMPPKKRPRPTPQETEGALSAIDAVLGNVTCNGSPIAGRVTLRRLNRTDYNNTIRDLVGVDFEPAADFPADETGYGFDNNGDVLSVSPLLLEKYLSAAESIMDRAVVNADTPRPTTIRLDNLQVTPKAGEVRQGSGTFLYGKGRIAAQNYFDEGDYVIRVEVYAQHPEGDPVRGTLRIGLDEIKEFEVKADASAPETIEAKVRLKAGTSRFAVAFLNPSPDLGKGDKDRPRRQLIVRRITADGPYNPPPPVVPESHRRIMAHKDGLTPREAAREIITRFASRAFRRPVKPEEVEHLLTTYDQATKDGERFEEGIRLTLCRVLVSPDFLFRIELDPAGARPGATYRVGDYELASRLSYFLWSSMPDDELLSLAEQGSLRQDLDYQVHRMLQDPKSAAFVENFAGQWLTLRNLANAAPDPKRFPGFDEDLRLAMRRESELFFEAVLREDRSIFDFLDGDYSFINERLAKLYGIPDVRGKEFRRVKLPANRRGILTQASILTLTSNPTRTSPVKRGKWVLDQILNTPPPPPPPDVPPLPPEKELTGTLRQVMEQHRKNTLCASCHQRMDPIGFAFENYDATGAWRDREGGFPIDSSGVLPDGQSFKGPVEMIGILEGNKEVFSRALAEKTLTYALGRGLETYDKCAVDKIVAALQKDDYRFSALVEMVVRSEPFQMRTAGGKP